MSTHLVVAHQTAQSHELTQALKHIVEADQQAEFVLLVPATPSEFLVSQQEGSARDVARRVAKEAAASLRSAGFTIKWTVIGDQSPIVALDTEVRDHPEEYAGLVVATFPQGRSRWLDLYLLQAAEALSLPLVHVVDDRGVPSSLSG